MWLDQRLSVTALGKSINICICLTHHRQIPVITPPAVGEAES